MEKTKWTWDGKAAATIVGIGIIAVFVVLSHIERSGPQVTPSGEPVSDISWSDIKFRFIDGINTSGLTSVQADEARKQQAKNEEEYARWWEQDAKGKWIRWRGTVKDVTLHKDDGAVTVTVDMGGGYTFGSDVWLYVDQASKEKALKLSKDSYVTFMAKLERIPQRFDYSWVTLKDAIIE